MRDFEYRTPRFMASAEFQFRMGDACLPGVCTNVSQGGVSALIDDSTPEVGAAGCLLLRYPQQGFTLGAVVTRVEGKEVGFSFIQRDEEERAEAASFAAFLEEQIPVSVGRHIDQDSLPGTS